MKRCLLLSICLLLAACAGLQPPPPPLNGFSASGRVVVRAGNEAHYANFGWQAAQGMDRLSLDNPLGQTLAELEIDYRNNQPVRAVLRESSGASREGKPEALLLETTGMQLPVTGLRWWLQGKPAPGVAISRDTEDGRVIEQDGWHIATSDYAEAVPVKRGPRRIELSRGEISVRIVISEWQWTTPRQ
ncbi:outer membrane lipoprotein LolB [Formivibrio citricus]|uniref:Outer-membrane lipoprotein LolB n=1 Tax=Formivibrio citricus TaxID=83765 RepID=A0A1I5DEG7_9NEIS|nr:lipoprotein insertase outer membrane protein LolB [Formivibrio citricus]SFN97648.1 outer membrane lipoprotein LolB [Formivibrio citricus]